MSTDKAGMRLEVGSSGKPLVRVFLSFVGRDEALVLRLWDLLTEAMVIDQEYEFQLWRSDDAILVGEDWDVRIRGALSTAEVGIVALSNAFLGSKYITGVELPALVDVPGKHVVPLLLRQVSKQADWRGLKSKQIYGYGRPFSEARGTSAQDAWVNRLVVEVHRVLARYAMRDDRQR
ncbi:toll/interleukin-1 receptor domain-containing protein [Saccharothrix syringae]|uniref:Toll/interleukin-1 receptor domain-containing protein n=1 Tax=Saccharothrix syringae TaxID=103733 RepID=A0A5Q0GWN6_SACSY|nr:toll/interleukin-1 receptor domain-containing protein [Saccharothrix syringae]QFZ18467.1 toll/interleukin-1 receptor domain-containing protein [Saccharothrix syringae]